MGEINLGKKRIGWIDIAKAICIIAVVLGHHGVESLSFVFSFHLTVFFILSGFTLKARAIDTAFLKNKFQRLMTPYFVTGFFVTAMEIINNFLLYKDYSIDASTKIIYENAIRIFFSSGSTDNFAGINMYNPIGAIWFLPAMFFCLVIVQYIVNNVKDERVQLLIGIGISMASAMTMRGVRLPFSIQAGAFAVPFVLFGNVLKTHDILAKIKWYHYVAFAIVFEAGCRHGFSQVFYFESCYAKDYLYSTVCAICSSFIVIGISRLIKSCKPIEFIGRNSLIILCVHLFELNTLQGYYYLLIEKLNIPYNNLIFFTIEFAVIFVLSFIVICLMNVKIPNIKGVKLDNKRDYAIDIMRIIAFCALILCTFNINGSLIKLLYVFNFSLLVMLSGYSFKNSQSIKNQLLNAFKTLIPYAVFGALYVAVKHINNIEELKTVLLGVTHTKVLLPNATSVGVIGLLLSLFLIKLAYIFIDKIKVSNVKHLVVFVLFTIGIMLGAKGLWLPWSIDVALVGLGLYHIANCLKNWGLLEKFNNLPCLYFLLSMIFMLELYDSPVNFEWRGYFNIGLMVLGSISLFIILYNMSAYIVKKLPDFMIILFSYFGRCSVYLLTINAIFAGRINELVRDAIGLNEANLPNLIMIFAIEILVCSIVYIPIRLFEYFVVEKRIKS